MTGAALTQMVVTDRFVTSKVEGCEDVMGSWHQSDRGVTSRQSSALSDPLGRRGVLALGCALVAGYGALASANARSLRFGMAVVPTSSDPHFHNLAANNGPLSQIYEPLVLENEVGELEPRLARSWRLLTPTTWEFELRHGVRFHDGTPFTARDVVESFARVPTVQNSPGLMTIYLSAVDRVVAVDDHHLRIETRGPAPFLLRQLANVMIVKAAAKATSTADFNSGAAAIGTGPYRFSRYAPGEVFECVANDGWWGGAVPWHQVSMRQISAGSARTAALLAGDVDIIEHIPFANLGVLARDPEVRIFSSRPSTTYYLALDTIREESPFARAANGSNPLRDVRVRRALSLAIDRAALVERVLDGKGIAAGQFASPGLEGSDPSIGEPSFDAQQARALLVEAGVAEGFSLTLHGTQGWIPQDHAVLQAIVQFWRRIGIHAELETLPVATYLARATRREFSAIFGGTGGSYAGHHLRQMVMTRNMERGEGTVNRFLYSNPSVDAAMQKAFTTMETDARNRLLGEAARLALADHAMLPIVFVGSQWASRKSVATYRAHIVSRTVAMLAEPAG